MTRVLMIFTAALICWASVGLSQDQIPKKDPSTPTPTPTTDVLKEAVDPFIAGKERARFLNAAGVDLVIDQEEFKADGKIEDSFVRVFDKWSNFLLFDANGDKKTDWFEASAYRRALRAAVFVKYDRDGNRKLTGEERDLANRDLAAGEVPKIEKPKVKPVAANNLGPGQSRQANTKQGIDQSRSASRSFGGFSGRNSKRMAELRKKYDTDGDGELNETERQEMFTAMRAEADKRRAEYIEQHDTDGDGILNSEERLAARQAWWENYKKDNPERAAEIEKRRAEYVKKYDTDGDGKLSDPERQAAYRARWDDFKQRYPDRAAEMEKRREVFMKQFDKNGDGEINEDERAAIGEYYRNRFRGNQSANQDDRNSGNENSGNEKPRPVRNDDN